MSVMLSTTNPEAVAEIEARDRRVPYVGQTVLFHARPGEGRQGKLVSPALVIGVDDEDHVELLIIYAADDFIVRWKIARKSEQNPINSWTFNAHDEKHYAGLDVPSPLAAPPPPAIDFELLYKEVGDLRNRVAELEGKTTSATTVRLPHAVHKKGL